MFVDLETFQLSCSRDVCCATEVLGLVLVFGVCSDVWSLRCARFTARGLLIEVHLCRATEFLWLVLVFGVCSDVWSLLRCVSSLVIVVFRSLLF